MRASEAARGAALAAYRGRVLAALQDAEAALVRFGTARIALAHAASAAQHAVEIARLDGLPLVTFCRPSRWRDQLDDLASERGIRLNVQLEADSLAVQMALVAEGGLYALLGGYAIPDAVARGRIQAARVTQPRVSRHAALALSRSGELTLAMRAVMQQTQALAKSLNPIHRTGPT